MFRRSPALVSLLPLLLVAGCSSSPTAPTPPAAGETRFEMSLELAASSVAAGQPLHFTIRVSNVGDGPGTLAFSSGCMTSFVVSNASGVIYDDRMVLRVCTANAPMFELRPGESVAWVGVWNQETPNGPAVPGNYRLQGQVFSAPAVAAAEAEFSITP